MRLLNQDNYFLAVATGMLVTQQLLALCGSVLEILFVQEITLVLSSLCVHS